MLSKQFYYLLNKISLHKQEYIEKKIYFQKIPDEISDSSKNNTNLWIFPLSLSLSYNSIYRNTITQQSDLLRQICLVRQISIKHQYMSILLSKMGTLLTDHCIYNILNITYLQKNPNFNLLIHTHKNSINTFFSLSCMSFNILINQV